MKAALALLAIVTLCGLTSCAGTPLPIPVGSNSSYYGYLVQGTKFGVTIGDSLKDANARLAEKGFEAVYDGECSHNLRRAAGCNPGQKHMTFSLRGAARHGLLFLEYEDDRVTAIIWDFGLVPYVDS